MVRGLPDDNGPHYQSAWGAFTGLFDKKRKGPFKPRQPLKDQEPEEDDDQDSRDPREQKDKKYG